MLVLVFQLTHTHTRTHICVLPRLLSSSEQALLLASQLVPPPSYTHPHYPTQHSTAHTGSRASPSRTSNSRVHEAEVEAALASFGPWLCIALHSLYSQSARPGCVGCEF